MNGHDDFSLGDIPLPTKIVLVLLVFFNEKDSDSAGSRQDDVCHFEVTFRQNNIRALEVSKLEMFPLKMELERSFSPTP